MTELDVVVLTRDAPAAGLRSGDLGTVVHCYPDGGCEVEFITGGGDTVAVLTLESSDVRPLGENELLHARAVG
ncbi:MAG TPA: DUF4926 domain-containing protein [Gemmatimonadales bacterium]|jgi:hypothetical protein